MCVSVSARGTWVGGCGWPRPRPPGRAYNALWLWVGGCVGWLRGRDNFVPTLTPELRGPPVWRPASLSVLVDLPHTGVRASMGPAPLHPYTPRSSRAPPAYTDMHPSVPDVQPTAPDLPRTRSVAPDMVHYSSEHRSSAKGVLGSRPPACAKGGSTAVTAYISSRTITG